MGRVCVLVLLISLTLVSTAGADLLYYSAVNEGLYEVWASVDFFSKSGFPGITSGTVHPESYSPGIMHLALVIDGNTRFSTDMPTELDLAGRVTPVTGSYTGYVYSSIALEAYVTPDSTTWRTDNMENPDVYVVGGEASVGSFTISPVPEPSGLLALLTGIAGATGILRRRAR